MGRPIGLMQGRLLPKHEGRYQAHPVGVWEEEFPSAATLGFASIEFILDLDGAATNPLLQRSGRDRIRAVSAASGVAVNTICADCFMQAPLRAGSGTDSDYSTTRALLADLLTAAEELSCTDVVIPCVDASALRDEDDRARFVAALHDALPVAESKGVNLAIECDLDPDGVASLLEQAGSSRVTVNYDIGNSASLGYDPVEEFAAYGTRISDVHIKDRLLGGASVPLGSGAADFDLVLDLLDDVGYAGPMIMQAFRDDEGTRILQEQLTWFLRLLKARTTDAERDRS